MAKIAVITDSDSSLPAETASRYGIRQVPILVHFGQETYATGVDINDRLLFEKVDRLKKLPTTSAPSPGAFSTAYELAFQDGAEAIVCICVSSKISATYSAALNACESHPGRQIAVIDSLSLSMGQGFMVLAAAEAAQSGCSVEEVIAIAQNVGSRVRLYAALSTLKYLAMSGRVGKVAAGLADTLNIKPVLTINDGKLELLERIRTRKKAVERMLELTSQAIDGKAVSRAAVIHINDEAGAYQLKEQLCGLLPCPPEVMVAEFSAGLSVHAGNGVVGLAVVPE